MKKFVFNSNLASLMEQYLERTAEKSANSASFLCFYEPKIPEALKAAAQENGKSRKSQHQA